MARVNMRELARSLGVDRSTISRALSTDKSHLVGKETREIIRKAAEAAGYRPNLTAATLRRGSSNTIGILVSDLENETFITVIRRVVAELGTPGQHPFTPLIGETRDSHQTSRELLDQFISRRVDAIISLASSDTDAEILSDATRYVPVILAIRKINGITLPTATCDDGGVRQRFPFGRDPVGQQHHRRGRSAALLLEDLSQAVSQTTRRTTRFGGRQHVGPMFGVAAPGPSAVADKVSLQAITRMQLIDPIFA